MDKQHKKTIMSLVNNGSPEALRTAGALLNEIAARDEAEEQLAISQRDLKRLTDPRALALTKRQATAYRRKINSRTKAIEALDEEIDGTEY